jgi:ABC-type Na+ efflux pump permease subunit
MATINTTVSANTKAKVIDARGPRFGAAITTVVLAVALVTHSTWLIGLQLAVFAIGAILSPVKSPYSFIYKKFVRPRLKGEVPTEDVRPPQFAQAVGLAFAVVAFVAGLFGVTTVFSVAVALCLAAAFLNAAFDFCLGCEMYLLIVRVTKR